MKRLLSELSLDELKKVYDSNSKLQQNVQEDIEESVMYWISEYLNCFRNSLSDWSIGFYQHNYIRVREGSEKQFLEGLLTAQKDYGFLKDEFTPKIEKLIEDYNKLEELYYDNEMEEEYNKLEEETEKEIRKIKDEVINQFNRHTSGDLDGREYFAEFYADSRLNEDEVYVDENYIMYETIIRSYE